MSVYLARRWLRSYRTVNRVSFSTHKDITVSIVKLREEHHAKSNVIRNIFGIENTAYTFCIEAVQDNSKISVHPLTCDMAHAVAVPWVYPGLTLAILGLGDCGILVITVYYTYPYSIWDFRNNYHRGCHAICASWLSMPERGSSDEEL